MYLFWVGYRESSFDCVYECVSVWLCVQVHIYVGACVSGLYVYSWLVARSRHKMSVLIVLYLINWSRVSGWTQRFSIWLVWLTYVLFLPSKCWDYRQLPYLSPVTIFMWVLWIQYWYSGLWDRGFSYRDVNGIPNLLLFLMVFSQ